MHRAHKIRLNPTPDQAVYFRKASGTARFAYNWALAQVKQALNAGEPPDSVLTLKKRFNAIKRTQFPWVYDVTKCAVEGAFVNLASALSNFWSSKRGQRKGQRMGFPRFKRKKRGVGSFYIANDKFSVDGYWLVVPKLGRVNMTEPLRFAGKILGATISERAGWWWVSIQLEVPREPPVHPGHALGVDVGLIDLAVTSDGERFENQKPFRRAIGRVKRLQRRVSRRQKGSQNRTKAVRQLARAHYHVACLRADLQHKLTTRLAQQAALLAIEDLNIAGMRKNRRLAGALADAALGELHRQLGYKAAWYGGQLVIVNRFYPSSRIHHGCGGYKDDLALSDRVWSCPACGALVDRDLNAARNIREEALRLSTGSGVATSSRELPVDAV